MFCKYCGKQIDDNAVFCGYCGGKQGQASEQMAAPVTGTSGTNRSDAGGVAWDNANAVKPISRTARLNDSRKKRKITITVAVVAAVIIVGAAVVLFFVKPWDAQQPLTVSELLDMGEKYLLDQNYEQALAQFLEVIEIEPKEPRGYTGAADAYIGLGDIDNAISIIERGIDALPDNASLREKLGDVLLIKIEFESVINENPPVEIPETHEQNDDIVESATPSIEDLKRRELIENALKIDYFDLVKQYGDAIYTATAIFNVPQQHLINFISTSSPIAGKMVVIGDYIYFKYYLDYGIMHPLYRSELNGTGEVLLIDYADPICAIGEKIIMHKYSTEDYVDYEGVFVYDTVSSELVELVDVPLSVGFISYDDEYIYYKESVAGSGNDNIWRIRWDGSQNEIVDGFELEGCVVAIDDEYYYSLDNVSYSIGYNVGAINRHYIADGSIVNRVSISDNFYVSTVVNGWVYLIDNAGAYRMSMDNGEISQIAGLPQGAWGVRNFYDVRVIDGGLYVAVLYETNTDTWVSPVRLYKVPIDGGDMEYQNLEWADFGA